MKQLLMIMVTLILSLTCVETLHAAPKRARQGTVKNTTAKRKVHSCPLCGKGPFTELKLKQHVCRAKKIECEVKACSKKLHPDSLEGHLLTQHKICSWCRPHQEYNNFPDLVEHCRTEHDKTIFLCSQCQNLLSLVASETEIHEAKCQGNRLKISCYQCPYEAETQKYLDYHLIKKHYQCPTCEFSVDQEQVEKLAQHLKTAHKRRGIYLCQNGSDETPCFYITCLTKEAKSHGKSHGNGFIPLTAYKVPKHILAQKKEARTCALCPDIKTPQSSYELKEHIVNKHIECPYGDNFCATWQSDKKDCSDDNEGKKNKRLLLYKHIKNVHKKTITLSKDLRIISTKPGKLTRNGVTSSPYMDEQVLETTNTNITFGEDELDVMGVIEEWVDTI